MMKMAYYHDSADLRNSIETGRCTKKEHWYIILVSYRKIMIERLTPQNQI